MNTDATKYVLMLLEKFGALCQLPKPEIEYATLTQEYLSNNKWTTRDLKQCLGWLFTDQEYQDNVAKFNKYPRIVDFMRAKKAIDDKIITYCVENKVSPEQARIETSQGIINNLTNQLSIGNDDIPY